MQVLPRLLHWVDLDPFYAKVKFGYIGFCVGKSENYVLFGNYCSCRPQSWFKYSNEWVNEVKWVSKVKDYYLTLAKGHSDFKIKSCFFSETVESFRTKFHMKAYGCMEWKFIQMSRVTWPRWLPCPYMVKTFKNLLVQNQVMDDLEI